MVQHRGYPRRIRKRPTRERMLRSKIRMKDRDSLENTRKSRPGYKRKDMFGVPFKVGESLRKKGWSTWRDCIPWIKRNGMVGYTATGPVSNIEWILILDKTEKVFYDHVAVMEKASESYLKDNVLAGELRQRCNKKTKFEGEQYQPKQDMTGNVTNAGSMRGMRRPDPVTCGSSASQISSSRHFRVSGLMKKENRLPWLSTRDHAPRKAHREFQLASPERHLPRPVKKDAAPKCGPLERLSEKQYIDEKVYNIATTGWEPTCKCGRRHRSGLVCDMFAGSSATGVACKNTKRASTLGSI